MKPLRTRFNGAPIQFLLRQQVNNRRQAATESLEGYTEDIFKRCSRLDIKGDEVRDIFIQGLLSRLKHHVILCSPKFTEKAVTIARPKNAVNKETSDTSQLAGLKKLVAELKDSICANREIQELRNQLTQLKTPTPRSTPAHSTEIEELRHAIHKLQVSRQTTPVSAYDNTPHQRDRNSCLAFEAPSEMNKLQNDLRRLQAQLDQLQVRNTRFGRTYNPIGRNQCTTSGVAICNNCLRVDHIARNCHGLLRDPHIPQQPRLDLNKHTGHHLNRTLVPSSLNVSSHHVHSRETKLGSRFHGRCGSSLH